MTIRSFIFTDNPPKNKQTLDLIHENYSLETCEITILHKKSKGASIMKTNPQSKLKQYDISAALRKDFLVFLSYLITPFAINAFYWNTGICLTWNQTMAPSKSALSVQNDSDSPRSIL